MVDLVNDVFKAPVIKIFNTTLNTAIYVTIDFWVKKIKYFKVFGQIPWFKYQTNQ